MNALCLVVLLAVAAVVTAEQCRDASGCSHVTCDATHSVACVRMQCTCSDMAQTCSRANDCSGDCRRDWHCIDGGCHCGWGILDTIGGGIGK